MGALETRQRIVEAAARLLEEGGREAVSTRAVSAAAGVQAPTIYRIFGDKRGLLDAVASHSLAAYLQSKINRPRHPDPVEDLRDGWNRHVEFGLTNPAFYTLIYGEPRPDRPAAQKESEALLAEIIGRIAEAGRLRLSEERAANLVHSVGVGVTFTLIGMPPERRDLTLAEIARESVIAAITTDPPAENRADDDTVAPAIALRAVLPRLEVLTSAERGLLREWLDRVADAHAPTKPSGAA